MVYPLSCIIKEIQTLEKMFKNACKNEIKDKDSSQVIQCTFSSVNLKTIGIVASLSTIW